MLEQVTQRGYGISVLGHIQNSTGHGPEQPFVADPALSRGVLTRQSLEIPSNLHHFVVL